MGGPDPLEFSEDCEISEYEELHPHEHLPRRSIIYFSIRNDLKGQDGSLCADTKTNVGRGLSMWKIRGGPGRVAKQQVGG